VWSVPERLECEVLQKVRYINTLTFTFTFIVVSSLFQERSSASTSIFCCPSSARFCPRTAHTSKMLDPRFSAVIECLRPSVSQVTLRPPHVRPRRGLSSRAQSVCFALMSVFRVYSYPIVLLATSLTYTQQWFSCFFLQKPATLHYVLHCGSKKRANFGGL